MIVHIDNDTPYSKAIVHAFHAHHGQYRHYSKQQYVHHVVRVSEHITEYFDHRDDYQALRVIALLHDVLEDTWMNVVDLRDHYNDTIVNAIKAVTHDKSLPSAERHKQYKEQLRDGPDAAKIVKLADIHDNTHDVMPDEKRYQSYLADSKDILVALEVDDKTFQDERDNLLETIEDRLKQ